MELDLTKIKKVFFIGIGGIGISALAKLAISRGIEVVGLNDDESKETLEPLRQQGVEIFFLKDFKELPQANMYVYSDAWLFRGPEIIENAKKTGTPVLSYFEALAEFAKNYKVLAISGTHGKTTTTAMVAEILVSAGLDPTVIVGSFVKSFGSNFRSGKGEYLVVEADEFARHMLFFKPYVGAVTNIEVDHLDTYKDLEDIKNTFAKFLSQSEIKISENDYEKFLPLVPKLQVPGEHNRKNAACAFAVAQILGIDDHVTSLALHNFAGTWRRLENRGTLASGTIVYDDYAHHPSEIRASLQALRELYPKGEKKIYVLFQPHMYNRTKAFFKEFSESFVLADEVGFLPIFYAREAPDPEVSSEKLSNEVEKFQGNSHYLPDFDSAEKYFREANFGPDDIFVTMGAGLAYKVGDNLMKI